MSSPDELLGAPLPTVPDPPRRLRDPWIVRARDALSSYLPILLMVVLALATWWLVRQAPQPMEVPKPKELRHVADYAMRGALLQSFDSSGRMRAQIEGDQIRHFPDTDTLEVDAVRLRSQAEDGSVVTAVARRAQAKADGSQVQLLGGASATSEGTSGREPLRIESEFLQVDVDLRRVKSHLPVTFFQGASVVRAGGFEHDDKTQVTQLLGPVRATLQMPSKRP